jgi:protease-4
VDKRAAAVLAVIFGGLFIALFGFMYLAYAAVKTGAPTGFDSDSGSTTTGQRIAVIELFGVVGDKQNGIDGEKVLKQIRKYAKDDDVKAILLHIDSPGGAVAPSQEIYEALRKLHGKKKIVVSMGDLAASGGYYIASAADWVIANPGTLTGSIGVIFQHFNVRGLLETVRVEETTFKSGKYKDTLSPFRPIGDQDREEIQGLSDDVYGQFIHDVAVGRGMKDEEVRAIAEGRIYTGRRAKELKLVDDTGSYDDALAKTWELSGLSGEPKVQLPHVDKDFNLKDLMKGSFEGAAAGVVQGVSGAKGSMGSGLSLIAPELAK